MSASRTLSRLKQSLGTATCLLVEHGQKTISTFLWGVGAIVWGSHIMLSKREEVRDGSNYRKQISSVLRMQDLSGIFPFDERLKDLMAFKAEFGHCNAPQTGSRNNKHYSLGKWCSNMRESSKAIKEGRSPGRKLSKADIQYLENAGFEWNVSNRNIPFDERLKDLMAFKAEFGHCTVPQTKSRNNKHYSLGCWCSDMRRSYKAIKKGETPRCKLSKANSQRLEKAGFKWCLK